MISTLVCAPITTPVIRLNIIVILIIVVILTHIMIITTIHLLLLFIIIASCVVRSCIGRADDTLGNPHRTQISQFELFELTFFDSNLSSLSSS